MTKILGIGIASKAGMCLAGVGIGCMIYAASIYFSLDKKAAALWKRFSGAVSTLIAYIKSRPDAKDLLINLFLRLKEKAANILAKLFDCVDSKLNVGIAAVVGPDVGLQRHFKSLIFQTLGVLGLTALTVAGCFKGYLPFLPANIGIIPIMIDFFYALINQMQPTVTRDEQGHWRSQDSFLRKLFVITCYILQGMAIADLVANTPVWGLMVALAAEAIYVYFVFSCLQKVSPCKLETWLGNIAASALKFDGILQARSASSKYKDGHPDSLGLANSISNNLIGIYVIFQNRVNTFDNSSTPDPDDEPTVPAVPTLPASSPTTQQPRGAKTQDDSP